MITNREVFIYAKGYEGYYEVSNFGRVRSVSRNIMYKDGRVYYYEGQEIKPHNDQRGYPMVGFKLNGRNKSIRVHRLVAETFIEKPFSSEKLEVNHIDGVKTNNRVDNLEWVTSSENTRKGYEIGLFDKAKASASRRMKRQHFNNKVTSVYEKETGQTKVYPSATKASYSHKLCKNYFTELIRKGGENKRFKAEYINN